MITIEDEDSILSGLHSKNLYFTDNGNGKSSTTKKNQNEKQEIDKKPKRVFVTYKYSQLGRGELKESGLIGDLRSFIQYNRESKEFESEENIEENNRILRPPEREEYPYTPYEFSSLEEINRYKDKILNENIDIDFLFQKSKSIISKYNNQDDYKLNLVAADVILSYFQDRFSTIHYDYIVGDNGSGKSSLGDTFGAIAYRAVNMTDPTAPNLFRLLGPVESAQCTMILEEAERIDKSPELMAILKTGYARNGRVPKINPNTLKQEFFFSYCQKVIISEKSLNQSIARGVNTRIIPINTFKGQTKYDIKEILNPTDTGGQQNKELLKELEDFRKLLLVYRLMHFKDSIPDLNIGVEGRNKELVKHLIQLFYGSNSLKQEIIKSLQKFLDIKNQKKESALDYALLPIISDLIKCNGPQMLFRTFWNSLKENISGEYDEKKPNEYHTEDYGTLYSTTITGLLFDIFGATTKHTRKGNMLIFDPEVIEKLSLIDKSKIIVTELSDNISKEEQEKNEDMTDCEGVKAVNTPNRGGHQIVDNKEIMNSETQNSLLKSGNSSSSNNHRQINSLLLATEVQKEQSSNTPISDAFTPFTPSQPDYDNINNHEEKQKSLIIHRRNPHSDTWVCDCCNWTGDIHFMKKHPCKHNNNKK